ncbi:hypothetical protein GGF31_007646 [Allomyces arbusculus]|nr:hypothetical protein GGF31_007646 [Allomyces arbusculus]
MTHLPPLHWRKPHQTIAAAAVPRSRLEPRHDPVQRSITGDAFEWSPSTCLVTLAIVVYAATVWRSAHLYYARRSWFYAGILAVVLAQVFDTITNLFVLANGWTPALFVIDMLIFISNVVLFEVVNILRYYFSSFACLRSAFVVYWTALLINAMYLVASGSPLGLNDATFQAWMAGFLFDAALNAALSLLFLVELRAMSQGNAFRPGLRQYVIRAQVMLVVESSVLVAVVISQGLDHSIDPLNLMGYLAQAIHVAFYCELLHILSRIMSRHNAETSGDAIALGENAPPRPGKKSRDALASTVDALSSPQQTSWFYAAVLVQIGAELYDLFFFLFGPLSSTATPVQMALNYFTGATLTIVFATMNFLRSISVMCYGFWNIVSFGQYGDTYIMIQLWADTFAWSPSTCLFTLIVVFYVATTWRAVHMFTRKRSWFYAAMLVLIITQLYDMACFVFGLQGGADSPALLVLVAFDDLACAVFTVLFASMNLVRFRQIGASTWPRTTKLLVGCTVLLAAYWTAIVGYGWWYLVAFRNYANSAIMNEAWAVGYLVDAVLNAILSMSFFVHLSIMAKGNAFRAGLQRYVTKAKSLLVLESISLVSVLALQLIDPTADPLWLTWYLAQGVRMLAYCTLIQLLSRIMSHRRVSRMGGQSTSFVVGESMTDGNGHSSTSGVMSAGNVRSSDGRIVMNAPRRGTSTHAAGAVGGTVDK